MVYACRSVGIRGMVTVVVENNFSVAVWTESKRRVKFVTPRHIPAFQHLTDTRSDYQSLPHRPPGEGKLWLHSSECYSHLYKQDAAIKRHYVIFWTQYKGLKYVSFWNPLGLDLTRPGKVSWQLEGYCFMWDPTRKIVLAHRLRVCDVKCVVSLDTPTWFR